MVRWRIAIVFVFSLLILNCTPMEEGEMIHGNEKFSLNIFEVAKFKRLAKKGDGDASLKLGRYYEFVQNDIEESYRWYTIGAETNSECLYELSLLMINSGDPDEIQMGFEGMSEAAMRGNERAIKYLKEQDY